MGYKITVKVLSTSTTQNPVVVNNKKCFLGISVGSTFINGKHVRRVLEWINSRYTECVILIGDDVQVYNEIMAGKTYSEAKKECTKMGDFAADKVESFLHGLTGCTFLTKRWSDFTDEIGFANYKEQLVRNFRNHPDFKQSVILCAEKYLMKKQSAQHNVFKPRQFALPFSIAYILEEMTVFSQLIEAGYLTVLYPGTFLKAFDDIINRSFANVDTILERATYIDLTIKKT